VQWAGGFPGINRPTENVSFEKASVFPLTEQAAVDQFEDTGNTTEECRFHLAEVFGDRYRTTTIRNTRARTQNRIQTGSAFKCVRERQERQGDILFDDG
jgi:hypothetical protein